MGASTTTAITARPPGRAQTFQERLRAGDDIAYLITLLAATSIVIITALLVWKLWQNSAMSRHAFGWSFLTGTTWDSNAGNFGALPFIYGTVVSSALALLIAIPLGVGAAIFLAELAPAGISSGLTFLIELLAAVPSVIFGVLGMYVLAPILQNFEDPLRAIFGWTPLFTGPYYANASMLTAGIVLSLMIIPFIISISREVILAVPNDQREAALALGATRWETTWDVVVRFAYKGIAGSVFLALARALGETMAVTLVIGNTVKISPSLFAPGYSIAAVIANEFNETTGGTLYQHALIELGLVLFALTIVINGLARLLVASTARD